MKKNSIGSHVGFALLLILVFLISGLATAFSNNAPALSVYIIGLSFSILALFLLLAAPQPGTKVESLCFFLLAAYLFTLVVWPRYALFRPPGLPGLSPTRIMQLALLFTWAYLVIRSPSFRARLLTRLQLFRPIFALVITLLAFKAGSIFLSIDWFASTKGVLNEIASVYLIFFIAISTVNSPEAVTKLLATFICAVFVASLFGLYESMVGNNLFLTYLEVDSDYLQQVLRAKIRDGSYRIQATFSHPLTLSECLAMAAPLSAAVLLRHRFTLARFGLFSVFIGIVTYVIYLTGSRSGIGALLLSLGIASTLICIAKMKRERERNSINSVFFILLLVALAFSFAFAIYLLSDILIGRTTREFNSAMVRLDMWASGLKLAAASPLLGYGQDMAAYTLGFRGHGGVLTIDSYYLSVLLESGYPSLAIYALILILPIWRALATGLNNSPHYFNILTLTAALIAFATVKAILSLTHNHGIALLLIGLLAYLIVEPQTRSVGATVARRKRA